MTITLHPTPHPGQDLDTNPQTGGTHYQLVGTTAFEFVSPSLCRDPLGDERCLSSPQPIQYNIKMALSVAALAVGLRYRVHLQAPLSAAISSAYCNTMAVTPSVSLTYSAASSSSSASSLPPDSASPFSSSSSSPARSYCASSSSSSFSSPKAPSASLAPSTSMASPSISRSWSQRDFLPP